MSSRPSLSQQSKANDRHGQTGPEVSALLQYLATSLLERYLWRITDRALPLDLAVSIGVFQLANRLRPSNHPHRLETLNNHAIAVFIRYEKGRKGSDLLKAIALHREALQLQQFDCPDHSSSVEYLENATLRRLERHGGDVSLRDIFYRRQEWFNTQSPRQINQSPKEREQAWPTNSPPLNRQHGTLSDEASLLSDAAASRIQSYQREGRLAVLTEAIHLLQRALFLRPSVHPDHSASLSNLASAMIMRYKRDGGERDLSDAINLYKRALSFFPPGHPNRSSFLNNLASSILERYERDGGERDLSDAIHLYQEALSLEPPGHPQRAASMNNLTSAMLVRYERVGGERDLLDVIDLQREALSLAPPGHTNRSVYLNTLGIALFTRYGRDGGKDLSDVIDLHREALTLRPPGHPDRSMSLNNLACALWHRFRRDGGERDLSDVIGLQKEALSLEPFSHPNRAASLSNLANAVGIQYERNGVEQDLSNAIDLQREALSLRPPGHPDRSTSLINLAATLHTQYDRKGGEQELSDIIGLHKEALSLLPFSHRGRSACVNNLATAIRDRYKHTGNEQDSTDVIKLCREALSSLPPGHPYRSTSLSNLSNGLLAQYERNGIEQHLSDAINLQREALSLRPSGHPDRSACLRNLADAILTRYMRDAGEADLADAIDLQREAMALESLGHITRSASLTSLAVAVLRRYERYGVEGDLSEVINLHREALVIGPPSHLHRAASLNNLARAILKRYKRGGNEQDLSDAIDLHTQALSHNPPGHPNRPSALRGISDAMLMRYRRYGKEEDLLNCIKLRREVAALQPSDDPDRSSSLINLADVISMQFALDGGEHKLAIMAEIVLLLRESATTSTSPIPVRLNAALLWIKIAIQHDPLSALEAYQCVFKHMGSALTLNRSLQARYGLLSQRPGSQPTRGLELDAANWALSEAHNDSKLAVVLLDQGRNALLASVGRSQADLSDVQRSDPALADEFYRISRVLDSAILSGQDVSEQKSSHEDPTNRYKRVLAKWEDIVAKIRLLPGCETFLLPAPYVKLQEAAAEGPVIVIIVGKESSTAVIVRSKGEPHTVGLPDASENALRLLHEELEDSLNELPEESRLVRKLPGILSRLWDMLIGPIIHELQDRLSIPLQSRIWWYPTSWASFLPLHAAGSYKKNGLNVPDLYISSYTPTLQALRRARRDRLCTDSNAHPGLLMVSQSETEGQDEIFCVNAEVKVVQRLVPNVTLLSGDQGTRVNVLQEMRHTSWIHLACHGVPDPADPFQSHFALHDGPLSLQDLIADELPSAEFAYMSTCHSAAQDRKLPDEGLGLAGGMQFAGFKSVVGTLWKMADEDAPTLAKVFYKSVAKRSGDGKAFDCTKTAEALHDAVKELRRKKVPLFRWVNLVHYGI